MSQAPISPLRRRMIEDMTVRGFGEKTQSDYIREVKWLWDIPSSTRRRAMRTSPAKCCVRW